MRDLLQDVRFGLRLGKRDPLFTVVGVLTLALGIAVNTTVFSWIDSILLRPYPGAGNPSELAVLETVTPGAPNGGTFVSALDGADYRRSLKSATGVALHREDVFSIGEPSDTLVRWGEAVSGNYFDVLQIKAAQGRLFHSDEHGVAVISHRLWRRNPEVLGRTLRVNQHELTVVGVTPPEFRGTMPGLAFDIWIPLQAAADVGMLNTAGLKNRGFRNFYGLVRLKPGIGLREARAETVTLARHLEAAFPKTNFGVSATILPPAELHSGAPELLTRPLNILMAVALLLLLIVCANIANLLLARSVARRKEMAIRSALGAGGSRLARQLLTETLMLSAAGAVAGLALTPWMADVLPAMIPDVNAPIAIGYQWSARVLGFMILLATAATVAAGLIPAIAAARSSPNDALKDGARGASEGLHSHRTRGILVTSEVTLACLALIAAGVFVRSFRAASEIYPGFDRDNVLLGRYYMSAANMTAPELQQFTLRLRDRLRNTAGVEDAAYADYAPLGTSAGPYSRIEVPGYVPGRRESMNVNRYAVSTGYFRTLHIPLLDGRDFRESDDSASTPVVIVNQAFAKRYFGSGPAVGRHIVLGGKPVLVVGLAKDSKYFSVAEAPRPHFYVPFRQQTAPFQQIYLFARTPSAPNSLAPLLRQEVATVDIMRLASWTDVTLLSHKLMASMATALGLISMLLAAVGLYSVMAHSVAQRTREIGIRMALGAPTGSVLRYVFAQGLSMTLPGILLGVAAAAAVLRVVSAMLVQVTTTDPLSYAGAAAVLLVVALLATWLPARRATKVDPMTALRSE